MPHSNLSHVKAPFALAIDIGSSSVRAVLFDAEGNQLRDTEHRERYKLQITPDGGSMCDPLRIRLLTSRCIERVCARAAEHVADIAVVGISCHWHSLLGLDRTGSPITPVYMWSDKRSSADAEALANQMPLAEVHQRTGCRIHSSYWPAKLHWLQRNRAEVVSSVSTWCGLPDWLVSKDGAKISTSLSMASGTGLMNTEMLDWDEAWLQSLTLDSRSLPRIFNRNQPLDPESIHPDLLPAGLNATWFAAMGDGAAANIGAGAVGVDRIALTIGTSGAIRIARPKSTTPLPAGLFRYLVDDRTEVIGGALSNGGNMISWLSNLTQSKDRKELMRLASAIAADSHGLTVLPFFAGERAPSWNDSLAGTITGMTLDTNNSHLLRAMLEATAYRFASVYDDVRIFADGVHNIVANGGALLQSPLWMQITADALGHDISALNSRAEASARGVAISALESKGILPSLRTDPEVGRVFGSNSKATEVYARARVRLESLESALTIWEKSQ